MIRKLAGGSRPAVAHPLCAMRIRTMSRDIYFQDWGTYKNLQEIPSGFKPRPIGKRSDIINSIKGVCKNAKFEDPAWGTLNNENCNIEFNMGENETLTSFAVHIRGSSQADTLILKLINHIKIRGSDGNVIYGSPDFDLIR